MLKKGRSTKDYKACGRTYATIRIYHKTIASEAVTDILKIQPDDTVKAGELLALKRKARYNVWSFTTHYKGKFAKSRDVRVHVEWLLDKLKKKKKELNEMSLAGYDMYISCFWEGVFGNGGPVFDPAFVERFSDFPLDLDFDIYFDLDYFPGGKKEKRAK